MDFPSRQRLFDIGRNAALRLSNVRKDVLTRRFSDYNIILNFTAAVGDEIVGLVRRVAGLLYLDSVRGSDLDRYVFNRYGLTRNPATPALAYVYFSFPAGTSCASFVIQAGTECRSTYGVTFVTSDDVTIPNRASSDPLYASAEVACRSAAAGASQQTPAASITAVVSAVTGAPQGMTCLNTLASVGADDAEKDTALRSRARASAKASNSGTKTAIEAAALAVAGVVTAKLVEGVDANGRSYPSNQLFITDRFTESLVGLDTSGSTYAAQADLLATAVELHLENYRAFGVPIEVTVAAIRMVSLSLVYTLASTYDSDTAVRRRLRAAAVAYVNAHAVGQSLDVAALRTVLESVYGVSSVQVVSPTTTVTALLLEALRTSVGLVAVNSTTG